jgi:hypothetical protein
MQSNLVVQANFITNFFIGAKGAYRGLVMDSNAPSHEQSGLASLNVSTSGKFSGSLLLGGVKVRLSGQFDHSGHAARTALHQKTNQLQITLDLDATPGSQAITGIVAGAAWSSPLVAYRSLPFPKTSFFPFTGRYEALVSDDTNAPGPVGSSVASLALAASGAARFKGVLADSTKLASRGTVTPNGLLPLYFKLYRGSGSLMGWLKFTNGFPRGFVGETRWIKTATTDDVVYREGFTNSVTIRGRDSEFREPGGVGVVTIFGPTIP